MATYALTRLIAPIPLTTSQSLVYTTPANTSIAFKQLLIANVGTNTAAVNIYIVPSGSTAGLTNLMFPAISLASNSSITFDLNQVLYAGDTIYASASTTSSINIMASGYSAA